MPSCARPSIFRLVVLSVLSVGCGARPRDAAPAPSASASVAARSVLPPRVEAVAQADELALAAARLGGKEGATLALQAADLRARLWRHERRPPDGLEALELYAVAARADPQRACDATLEAALLGGEIDADPDRTYREAYRFQAQSHGTPCAHRAGQLLALLAPFRPPPDVLAELARDAPTSAPSASAAPVRHDPDGSVVVPTLGRDAPTMPAQITSIERYPAEENARIVVLMTRPSVFEVGFIPKDGDTDARLFVDIKGARYKGALAFDMGGVVQRVRLGQQRDGTRLVLDLTQPVFRKVFYLPEPFRLVIDVSTKPEAAPEGPLAARGPRVVRRVVLDPGHGGHDPGATGPGGLREKDVTLDIAHRAAPLLARELGVATLLTRDTDAFVPLDERTARANAFRADLFLSIHCNASEDGQGKGVMTFVLDDSRDSLAAQIAARENAASPAAAAELASVMSRVVDEASRARSVHFAELLQRAARASLEPGYQVADRGVRRAGFYVLAGAHMPAALFEVSFISDPTEEAQLNTGDYRQKLADAIVNAVRAYRDGL